MKLRAQNILRMCACLEELLEQHRLHRQFSQQLPDPSAALLPEQGMKLRANFFSQRVLNLWNSLPGEVKNARNPKIFLNIYQRFAGDNVWVKTKNIDINSYSVNLWTLRRYSQYAPNWGLEIFTNFLIYNVGCLIYNGNQKNYPIKNWLDIHVFLFENKLFLILSKLVISFRTGGLERRGTRRSGGCNNANDIFSRWK